MVRIMAIGDLHFMKGELALADLVIQKLTTTIEENRPDIIVFLGDTLHTHSNIDMKTFNKAIGFFKSLAQKYPVFVIIGNHDRPDATTNLTDCSAFYCLRGIQNIYVIDRVLDIAYPTPKGKSMRFVFVPYVPPGTFDQALKTLQQDFHDVNNPVTAVFAHQTFVGASHGKTIIKSGDSWDESNPLLISGHIHVYKVLQHNLIYAGTPYQLRFDDESKKGVIMCDFDISREPDIRFIEMNIRRKVAISIKASEVDQFVPPDNCEVKVEIVGNQKEISKLNKDGIINKMRSKGVSVSLLPDKTSNPKNPEGKTFRQLVEQSIEDDADALEIYRELFQGGVDFQPAVVERKEQLSHLMEIMNSINGPTMTFGDMIVPKPEEVRSIKETPPHLIDSKGKKFEPKPSLAELQNSLKDSAKEKPIEKKFPGIQDLLDHQANTNTKK